MSSKLLYLTFEDFFLSRTEKGPIMNTSIRGFSVLMFYSDSCPISRKTLPIFTSLPISITNCTFGIVNIDKHRRVLEMASKTIGPITHVPYIAFYVNGKIFMVYKDTLSKDHLSRFVFDASMLYTKRASTPQQGHQQNGMPPQRGQFPRGIPLRGGGMNNFSPRITPDFSIGIPVYGTNEDLSYLAFDPSGGYKITSKMDKYKHISVSGTK
jgi:hypothetical protein